MYLEKIYEDYIVKAFKGCCPFCLISNANWKGYSRLFKKFTYHCSSCDGKITFKQADILQNNYDTAIIEIENAGGHKLYESMKWQRVKFSDFYAKSILSQHYHKVALLKSGGYPDSCRLCDYAENQPDDISICNKFWLQGSSNCICDSYSDKDFKKMIDMMIK